MNPAFPRLGVVALTNPKSSNTFLSSSRAVKIKKMSQPFSNNNNSFNIGNTINYAAPDDETKILTWLSPLEPWVRHRDIGAERVDGIGAWLLETREFRRWHDASREDESNYATLFCDGNPGVGKSYIM